MAGHVHGGDHFGQGGGYIQHGRPAGAQKALPYGEVVTVFPEGNRNYRLTSRVDGVVLAYKNQQNPEQYWIKVDCRDISDQEGSDGFLLVNKATGHALSHGAHEGAAVTQEPYCANFIHFSVLWSQGRNEGKYKNVRSLTNIKLNLDADDGDKKHGRIQEGNRLVVHSWHKQRWMLSPVGPED